MPAAANASAMVALYGSWLPYNTAQRAKGVPCRAASMILRSAWRTSSSASETLIALLAIGTSIDADADGDADDDVDGDADGDGGVGGG